MVGPAPVEAPGNVTTAPVWHGFCNLEADEVRFSTIGDTAKEFLLEQDGSCRVKKPGQLTRTSKSSLNYSFSSVTGNFPALSDLVL